MAENWIPPAAGSPCYVQVPALDPERAKNFYANVFNWVIRARKLETETYFGFTFPEDKFSDLSGGFHVVDAIKGGETLKMYLYVDNLEKAMESIIANGGKKRSEVLPESDFGLMMEAEDTEGNPLGIYTMKNKS